MRALNESAASDREKDSRLATRDARATNEGTSRRPKETPRVASRESSVLTAVRIACCLIATSFTAQATAAETPDDVLFVDKVWPILKEKCMGCHGDRPEKIKADYDMRTYAGMLKGGESEEAAIIKGKPEESPFYLGLTWEDEDFQMPPKENDRLTKEQMAIIHEWIKRGAPYSDPNAKREIAWGDVTEDGMVVETSGGLDDSWTYRRYEIDGLWAYQPISRLVPPDPKAHPVDAFVNQRLQDKGIKPAKTADKRNLLRRATFALTGLPPTPAAVLEFENDDSPTSFSQAIDRLQASPHYGEKMAQHWLDVVRYADTSGFSNDFERPTAWRYRDYVVRSFNADKPYDQFVREQLAGDESEEPSEEGMIAAGFLRMGPWEHTGMSVAAETRQLFLDDVTHSAGVTFLGQQMRCAKCHDHKFDPIPTADYYRFQAIFATIQFADRDLEFLKNENVSQLATGKRRISERLANADNRDRYVKQEVDRLVAQEIKRRGGSVDAATRKSIYDKAMKDQSTAVNKATRKQKAYYNREAKRYEPYAYTVYNGPNRVIRSHEPIMAMPKPKQMKGEPEQIHILTGGSLESPSTKVQPNVLSVVNGFSKEDVPLPKLRIPQTMTGRRNALADWIVDRNNPLTARVMVNRVWQHLFSGQALVGTPNDFGKMGKRPTHPMLLDYLSHWFMDNGWSVKKLQAFIMASETYQRAAAPADARTKEVDAGNALLSYFPPRRLQAEELRDGMLAATGELNLEAGGPGTFPEINWEVAFQPRLVMGTIAPVYQPSPKRSERHRRAIYHFRYRSISDPLLEVFNRPGSEMACDTRDETIIAPQAFALFNSEFVHDRALALAETVAKESNQFDFRIQQIYRRLFSRMATVEELALCRKHFDQQLIHHRLVTPKKEDLPLTVERVSVEELTGEPFVMIEELDNLKNYERDLKPWDASPEVRALAEVCLVLLNSNEFSYVY